MAKRQKTLFDSIGNGKPKKKGEDKSTNTPTDSEKKQFKQYQIDFLVVEIQRHRDLYYNKTPEISDAKYDLLEDELRELDPDNPLLAMMGKDSIRKATNLFVGWGHRAEFNQFQNTTVNLWK